MAVLLTGTTIAGNVALHAGNVSTYALPIGGGTLTGQLNLHAGLYEGSIVFGSESTWRTGIRQHDDGDAELRIWAKNANGMIFIATGYDGEPASISRPADGLAIQGNKLGIGNFSTADPSYKLHVKGDIYANGGWVRVSGSEGLYFESYAGGWRMTDSTWIRAYNDKNIYTGGSIEAGGSVRADSGILDSNRRFVIPGGASTVNHPSGTTGAIRINLPTATYGVNTMMSMTVQVYEYSTGQSFTIRCGGYNYYNHDWYNVFAYLLNDSGKGGDVPVYFGNDGTRDVIWIGEPGWSWSYPNVFVTDFQAGHSQYESWKTGWSISFDTAARTNVSASRTAYRQIDTGTIGSQSVSYATTSGSTTGNAATATTLATARTLTIGNTGKTFNGSANVSWTLAEIGAQASGSYLTTSGKAADSELLDGIDSSGFQRQIDQSIVNIGSPDASSGTWTTADADDWGTPRIGSIAARYNDGTGYLQFNVPAGMDSAYISHLTWDSGGYVDCYGVQADGGLVFLRRINTRQSIENSNEGSNGGNPNQHDGTTITLVGTGLSSFSAIRLQNRVGRFHLTGMSFTSAKLQGTEGTGMVHPAQLSVSGSGSGLDADLLDGNHASAFYLASNPSGYITGNQTITLSGDVSGSGTTSIAVTVNNIDGWGFVNTGSNSATNADTINSNGISYYTGGVTNFSGNSTDGALYSQRYSDSWQHQIAGDYRSGQIALRGKNNGTWQAWRTVLDSSNFSTWAAAASHTHDDRYYTEAEVDSLLAGKQAAGSYAAASHEHDRTFLTDSRGAARLPSYYDDRYAQWDFQNSADTGAGGDTWHGLLTVAKWTVYDGSHRQEQLAFTGNDLKRRTASSDSAWGGWKTILDSDNYNSYSPTLTGTGASGTWGINITGSANSALTAGSASTAGYATEAKWIAFLDGIRNLSDRLPNWNNQSVAWDFVTAATANGSGNYGGVMTFVPYDGTTASTGDSSYQLAFANATGVNASGQPKLSIRNGIDSTWNAWYTLIHSGNIGSQSVSYATTAGALTSMNISQFTNNSGYITSYTETDTLATVTARGNTTNGSINVHGNILLTGPVTTTNQGRMIDFTGFDKEGTTDFSDRAYIQHTVNTGGHAGSVLVLSSQNDADDGIAFLTNASSKLKHNSNNIATETWVTSQGYITSSGSISGNAATATIASTVTVNSGNTSAAWYPIVWHSGNTVYSSSGVEIYANGNYIRCQYINTTDNDESGITRFVIKNGDSYHRSATTTVAADIIRGVASGTWSINVTGSAGSATTATTANRLERYGVIYGNNWNDYYLNNRLIAASAHNATGTNKPDTAYNYGSTLSYYNSGEDHYQIYVTENSVNSNGKDRKMYYRSGWNGSWGGWRSVVDVYNSVCYIDAAVTATGDITAYSDARIKENVNTLESALDKTLSLRGVSYNRTDIEDKSTKIGFIAQELLEVIPEVVTKDESGMYGVSYGNITALLVEAIKEQQKQIEELKLEIQKLKSI